MWRYSRTFVEALHALTAVVATAAAFSGAAWAYPPGRRTIWIIGAVTMIAIAAMVAPQLLRAWRADRGSHHG
ncbi:hypothetical protein [Sphingomonas sp.]|jgi:hypothetical protein|uniref:hypothetical protein n=1 Tax=Sphingomonas sp. TaxID=28214 RepID=UPI0035C7AD62